MGRPGIGQGAEHHLAASGTIGFPLVENLFDLLALQPILAAT